WIRRGSVFSSSASAPSLYEGPDRQDQKSSTKGEVKEPCSLRDVGMHVSPSRHAPTWEMRRDELRDILATHRLDVLGSAAPPPGSVSAQPISRYGQQGFQSRHRLGTEQSVGLWNRMI